MLKKIKESTDHIRSVVPFDPEIGIVLGTGLGGLTREIEEAFTLPYSSIPHFPSSTVQGHAGSLIFGYLSGKKVVAMNGRFHYYEGYSLKEVTFPVRVMKELGIRLLILSNACGGLNPEFSVGDIMFIDDHINLMHDNPLIGLNDMEYGPRFPDMSRPYDEQILQKAIDISSDLGIAVHRGVYAAVTGPTFETKAEYRFIRLLGADAVGMSTVPEVIVANQLGLPVMAVSIISDLGVEGKIVEITHEAVIDAASHVEPKMTLIIKELLKSREIIRTNP